MKNDFDDLIKEAAAMYLPDTDWRLLKSQYWQESRFDEMAISPAGARGIAQFMPDTWREWSPRAGFKGVSPHDPEASIKTGAAYMAHLKANWHSPRPAMDRHCLAMASYNAGLGHLLRAQRAIGGKFLYSEIIKGLPQITGRHSEETISYVRRILAYYSTEVTG